MKPNKLSNYIGIRFDSDANDKLIAVARHHGKTKSEMVRIIIRAGINRLYAEIEKK